MRFTNVTRVRFCKSGIISKILQKWLPRLLIFLEEDTICQAILNDGRGNNDGVHKIPGIEQVGVYWHQS